MTRVAVVDLLCGSPFYSAELTNALREAGLDAELASPLFYAEPDSLKSYRRSPWITDLVVHASQPRALRLALRSIEMTINVRRLLARIAAGDYDVVDIQWIPFADRTALFMDVLRDRCDRSGTLLVFSAHNAFPHDRPRTNVRVLRRSLNRAHLIVAHSQHVAAELSNQLGTKTPVVWIPLGPQFLDRHLPSRADAARRLGCPPPPIVLFFGLIRPYKGMDLLAEAWPTVSSSFPDATLMVVGKVLGAEAERELGGLRTQSNVIVVDRYVPVAWMLDYYAVSDIVVLPYRRASQSAALMTAVSLGRPTVVTPIAGLQEQVQGLQSAVVADEVNGAALARALTVSLGARREMAAAAQRDREGLADSPLGWAAVSRATARAYEAHRPLTRNPARRR